MCVFFSLKKGFFFCVDMLQPHSYESYQRSLQHVPDVPEKRAKKQKTSVQERLPIFQRNHSAPPHVFSHKPIHIKPNVSYSASLPPLTNIKPDTTTLQPSPKQQRKPRQTKTKICKLTEETESNYLRMMAQRDTTSSTNTEEHSEMKFDPVSGLPVSLTTHLKHQSQASSKEQLAVEWQQEKTKRQAEMRTLMSLKPEEAMGKSQGIKWYREQLAPLLRLFHEKCRLENVTVGPNGTVWKHPDFILRFLFNLPNSWEKETHPDFTSPPWLACCWSMQEMLDICNDECFVQEIYLQVDVNKSFAKRNVPKQFIVDTLMMSGYTTGQLLGYCIPSLYCLMRDSVREERNAIYFPRYYDSACHEDDPAFVRLDYNFSLVPHLEGVPRVCAMNCEPQAKCFLLGSSGECDGPLIQLLNDSLLKTRCFAEVESVIYKEPEPYDARFEQASLLQLTME